MSTPVERIRSLLEYVPAKDIPYATKFLQERNFEALRDLVKSDIQILRKRKDDSLEEQIDFLKELKAEVDSYLLLIGLEEEGEDETDFWGGDE